MSIATAATNNLFCFYDYIQNGDAESLRRHLTGCSTDIDAVLPCKGVGLLHLAVGIEPVDASIQCTEIILKHGGDPNLCSEDGTTPVHLAAIWGRLDNLRLLVACGGNPAFRDDDGRTAYDYAACEQQWHVYDYLCRTFDQGGWRNARDLCRGEKAQVLNHSSCTYSLQLDRVLVSTGHVVAEYGTVSDNRLTDLPVTRKSEMVREWCENTSHVNRLYPTILNQTYRVQDESAIWKPGEISKDNAEANSNNNNVSLDDTKNSYKSCFSKKLSQDDLRISGIQILQKTVNEEDPNCNCDCHDNKVKPDVCTKRFSVYENFSLPGSPTNITHQNYKSKTSLRKNKPSSSKKTTESTNSDSSSKKLSTGNSETINNASTDQSNALQLLTVTDKNVSNEFLYVDYRQLNDALAIVQNETNEWLSQSNSSNNSDDHLTDHVIIIDESDEINNDRVCEILTLAEQSLIKAHTDTRRLSQRSSGVNSTESSGSIAIASVQEEYKYEDKEEDVILIEKRLLIPSVVLAMEETAAKDVSPEQSRHSVASSLPASIDYDEKRLRAELTACGFNPGPINSTTKRLYLRKLKNLKKNPSMVKTPQGRTYSIELEKSLKNETWFDDLSVYVELESKVRSDFANPKNSRLWREGSSKTSFTYLLLDPRLTDNLPVKSSGQSKHVTWTTFINSIFYVGKGKRSRPYSHLYQALTLWKRDFRTTNDKKVQHIIDIWSDQVGVICLHVFQNVIPAEAYTYEASMIDVLGLTNLKNLKSGNYYGAAAGWSQKERRMFGLYLLYKAMLIFLNEGERQLRPGDID